MNREKPKIFLAHTLAILLWASAFPGIRYALSVYSPVHLSLFRLLIGSVLLVMVALCIRLPLPRFKDIPMIMLLGCLAFAVYHVTLNIGEQTVSAGVASLLVSTSPIFTASLSTLLFKEKFKIRGWLGALIAFCGMIFIAIGGTGERLPLHIGFLLILTAALSESFYFVYQNSYLKRYGFFPFTIYTIWAGTISMLPFSSGLLQEIINAPPDATLTVVYLGIFPTVIPYFALAYITSKTGAAEATSSLYLTPAVSFLIAWIWLGEAPNMHQIIGSIITLCGVFMAHFKWGIRETLPRKGEFI